MRVDFLGIDGVTLSMAPHCEVEPNFDTVVVVNARTNAEPPARRTDGCDSRDSNNIFLILADGDAPNSLLFPVPILWIYFLDSLLSDKLLKSVAPVFVGLFLCKD